MYKINRLRDYGIILLAFLAQVFLAEPLKLGDAKPNFMIVVTVFFALFTNEKFGLEAGFISGAILDVFAMRLFGMNMVIFSLAGYFVGRFNDKIYRESIITHAIIIFLVSFFIMFFQQFFIGIGNRFLMSNLSLSYVLSLSVIISAFYNSFLGTLVYTSLCRMLKLGETSVL